MAVLQVRIEGDKPTFNPYFYVPKYLSSDALPAPEIYFFPMAGFPMKFAEMPTSEECGRGVRHPPLRDVSRHSTSECSRKPTFSYHKTLKISRIHSWNLR